MKFVGSLLRSLMMLPNYIGVVHRGVRNLRLSSLQKVGDVFYWKAFTSTSIDPKVAQRFKQSKGTILHINSLTGKDLSLYSIFDQEQ